MHYTDFINLFCLTEVDTHIPELKRRTESVLGFLAGMQGSLKDICK